MGLDISVYEVIELPVEKWDSNTEYRIIDDYPELKSVFGEKTIKKELDFFDLEPEFEKYGIKSDTELFWLGESYGDDVIFEYGNTQHELFECFKFLNSTHINMTDEEEFKNTDEFKKYRSEFLPLLEKYGFKENFPFNKKRKKNTYFTFNHVYDFVDGLVRITIINPGTIKKSKDCLVLNEVGYQRKGANKKFYSDDMWDSPCVTSLEVLKEHHEKYFSYPTPEDKGGWGSGVEYDMTAEEMKKYFQENIVDKFEEGKTFVIYH